MPGLPLTSWYGMGRVTVEREIRDHPLASCVHCHCQGTADALRELPVGVVPLLSPPPPTAHSTNPKLRVHLYQSTSPLSLLSEHSGIKRLIVFYIRLFWFILLNQLISKCVGTAVNAFDVAERNARTSHLNLIHLRRRRTEEEIKQSKEQGI
ncbi:hypothetical protein J6590_029621 [Homalodisca vitripennis]|nr:hypothetical protein J6590_029621 [Homalodisca vitripennis]